MVFRTSILLFVALGSLAAVDAVAPVPASGEAPAAASPPSPAPPPSPSPSAGGASEPAPPSPAAPLFSDAEWNGSRAPATPATGAGGVASQAAGGMMLSLLVVVVIAVGLAVLVKRFGIKRMLPARGRHLEVVETVAIGFKRSVTLVRIGDQVLVIGQGDHELHALATLPAGVLGAGAAAAPGEPAARPAPAAMPGAPTPSGFQEALERLRGRG